MDDVTPVIDQVDPAQAYQLLSDMPNSVLIDVRTEAEWARVGLPDLTPIGKVTGRAPWALGPGNGNPNFLEEVRAALGGTPVDRAFFICKSGARSMAAAHAVAEVLGRAGGPTHCTNVAEGFEGDAPPYAEPNGWMARGLPWHREE